MARRAHVLRAARQRRDAARSAARPGARRRARPRPSVRKRSDGARARRFATAVGRRGDGGVCVLRAVSARSTGSLPRRSVWSSRPRGEGVLLDQSLGLVPACSGRVAFETRGGVRIGGGGSRHPRGLGTSEATEGRRGSLSRRRGGDTRGLHLRPRARPSSGPARRRALERTSGQSRQRQPARVRARGARPPHRVGRVSPWSRRCRRDAGGLERAEPGSAPRGARSALSAGERGRSAGASDRPGRSRRRSRARPRRFSSVSARCIENCATRRKRPFI